MLLGPPLLLLLLLHGKTADGQRSKVLTLSAPQNRSWLLTISLRRRLVFRRRRRRSLCIGCSARRGICSENLEASAAWFSLLPAALWPHRPALAVLRASWPSLGAALPLASAPP